MYFLFARIRRCVEKARDEGSLTDRTGTKKCFSHDFARISVPFGSEVRSDCSSSVLPPYLRHFQRRILVERYCWTDNKRRKFRVPHSDLYVLTISLYDIYIHTYIYIYIYIYILYTYCTHIHRHT